MAIAHDTTTTASAYTSTGTQTTSHAGSASARGAVVLIAQNASTADQVSGVTYGGVDMKRLRFDTEATETGGVYIYWLDEVPTGTQNVAMTTTGTANKQLSVSTMTVTSGKVVRPVGVGNTATSASAANPALTLSGLTASTVYQCYEVIHSGLTTMTNTPQTSPAWTLISSTDLGSQGRGFARINNTPGGTTITAGWIAATADDYVISGVAFYETDPPSADGLPNAALAAWWAADDLALSDNDAVTSWTDRVAGLALSEATNPPTFKTSILNGLPAVRFSVSGTDDSLQTASTVGLFNSVRGGTVFVVGSSTGAQATYQTFFATDTSTAGTDRFSVYATATDGYLGQYGRRLDANGLTSKPSTTVAPSTPAIIRAVSDWAGGTYDLRVDGTSIGSGAYTSSGTTSFTDAAKFRVGRSNTANYGLDGDVFEVIVYERVLTSTEISTVEAYLSAKYFLTPVEASRGTTWNVAAQVSATRATTWTARAAVTPATRATTWTVRTAVGPSTRATTWTTAAQTAASRATTWSVLTPVTASRATTWDVASALTPVSASRATTWHVAAQVASTRASTWAVRAAVASTRATTWTVRAAVAPATRATTWRVLGAVSASRATTWAVRGQVSGSRATSWAVRAAVSSSRASTWEVRAQVAGARASSWRVLAQVSGTRSSTWNVAAQVAASRAALWAALAQVAAERSTTWRVIYIVPVAPGDSVVVVVATPVAVPVLADAEGVLVLAPDAGGIVVLADPEGSVVTASTRPPAVVARPS